MQITAGSMEELIDKVSSYAYENSSEMYSQKAKRALDRNLIFGDRGDRYED